MMSVHLSDAEVIYQTNFNLSDNMETVKLKQMKALTLTKHIKFGRNKVWDFAQYFHCIISSN